MTIKIYIEIRCSNNILYNNLTNIIYFINHFIVINVQVESSQVLSKLL